MAECSGASDLISGSGIHESSIVDTDINSTLIHGNSVVKVSEMAEHCSKDTRNYRLPRGHHPHGRHGDDS